MLRRVQKTSPSVVRPVLLMCLLVDVETRHRWLLNARYAAVGKRATHESVADVSTTLFFFKNPVGVFSPGPFFVFDEVLPTSLFSPGTFYCKKKLAPGGVDRG